MSGARVGDRVRAFLQVGSPIEGTVKHIPGGVGDSWVIWQDDGSIHHVQQFETMLVLDRKADPAT